MNDNEKRTSFVACDDGTLAIKHKGHEGVHGTQYCFPMDARWAAILANDAFTRGWHEALAEVRAALNASP